MKLLNNIKRESLVQLPFLCFDFIAYPFKMGLTLFVVKNKKIEKKKKKKKKEKEKRKGK